MVKTESFWYYKFKEFRVHCYYYCENINLPTNPLAFFCKVNSAMQFYCRKQSYYVTRDYKKLALERHMEINNKTENKKRKVRASGK